MSQQTHSLPSYTTTLDLIKTVAVIFMIIDHIGFYFFPDMSWFRVLGRLGGVPIWFFLIGYASSREIPQSWMVGALTLAVFQFALIGVVFPFNVLVTLILLRLFIDPIMGFVLRSRYIFFLSLPIFGLFYIFTNMILEYGTLALSAAILGYCVRHQDQLKKNSFVTQYDLYGYAFLTVVINVLMQSAYFEFDTTQRIFLMLSIGVITIVLFNLKVEKIDGLSSPFLSSFFQFCGRKTLEIYVIHRCAFILIFYLLVILGFHE